MIDRGEPVVAMAGKANADSTAAAATEPKALPSDASSAAADGSWRSRGGNRLRTPAKPHSHPPEVRSTARGLEWCVTAKTTQRVPTESPAGTSDASTPPAASADHSKQVIFEWTASSNVAGTLSSSLSLRAEGRVPSARVTQREAFARQLGRCLFAYASH